MIKSDCFQEIQPRHGFVKRFVALASATVLAVAVFTPATVQAGSITQLEYLQWLVQLAGDSGKFNANSSGGDYANWARSKGMDPAGGWQLNGKLSKEVLAQTVAQFLNLNPGKQKDYLRALRTLGIELPDSNEISREELVALVDSGLQPRSITFRVVTPTKPPPGLDNVPPPGWNKNPNNPHFGQEPGFPPRGNGNGVGPIKKLP
jgi:hypothetical protein